MSVALGLEHLLEGLDLSGVLRPLLLICSYKIAIYIFLHALANDVDVIAHAFKGGEISAFAAVEDDAVNWDAFAGFDASATTERPTNWEAFFVSTVVVGATIAVVLACHVAKQG
jgi:hypothetical protein